MLISRCKYFFLLFSCLYFNFLFAQPIPGATQQPQWSMALYFLEAGGARDTLYFGYDSLSYWGNNPHDTIYGEKKIPVDTAAFHAKWSSGGGCSAICDSIYKVEVSPFFMGYFPLDGTILFQHGNLPVQVSWDVSVFHSDSLPFPDQDPLPRAQGELYFAYSFYAPHENGNWLNCSSGNDYILISDTSSWLCSARDSITLLRAFGNPSTSLMDGFFVIKVREWSGLIVGENPIPDARDNILIYPNPASDKVNININNAYGSYNIIVSNMMGQLIKSMTSLDNNIELDMSDLCVGIYFLKIISSREETIKKIILIK